MRQRTKPDFERQISSGTMGDLVYVGLGMSNTFSILYLLENGYNPRNIRVLEQGYPIDDPKRKRNILIGAAGAGGFSDGKMIFSEYKDLSIIEAYGDVSEDYNFIKRMIEKFHPDPSDIGKTQPSKKLDDLVESAVGWGKMSILQSETWHLGTSNSQILFKNIYDYFEKVGVDIQYGTKLVKILDKYGKYVSIESEEDEKYNSHQAVENREKSKARKSKIRKNIKLAKKEGDYYKSQDLEKELESINYSLRVHKPTETEKFYTKLILGLGKTGKSFLDEVLDKRGIQSKKRISQIGVRFETPYSEKIQEVASEQYDFKFQKYFPESKMRIRTFCVNHESAYVVEEKVTDFEGIERGQFNGHAYGLNSKDRKNGLSNWGIIAEVEVLDADNYIEGILRSLNFESLCVNGDSLNFEGTQKDIQSISKEEFINSYGDLGKNILTFIEEVNKILGYGENYKFYLPEIKISSGKIPSKDTFRLDEYKDIFILGDLSNLETRGIVPAGVHGVRFSKSLIKK